MFSRNLFLVLSFNFPTTCSTSTQLHKKGTFSQPEPSQLLASDHHIEQSLFSEKERAQLVPDVAADTPVVNAAHVADHRLQACHLPQLRVRPPDEAQRRERRHELRELQPHLGKVLDDAQHGPAVEARLGESFFRRIPLVGISLRGPTEYYTVVAC